MLMDISHHTTSYMKTFYLISETTSEQRFKIFKLIRETSVEISPVCTKKILNMQNKIQTKNPLHIAGLNFWQTKLNSFGIQLPN